MCYGVSPSYGYGPSSNRSFSVIVVLFILLIIVLFTVARVAY
ncbi:sporulation protein YjcZ [Cytobacillus sp. IB215665]|nr:sporulation protein YjcZ [Cytobacillus sp. IB215665]MDX8366659.1 sporulation protein YjcZ [Cytobacillus sp. IB215665]